MTRDPTPFAPAISPAAPRLPSSSGRSTPNRGRDKRSARPAGLRPPAREPGQAVPVSVASLKWGASRVASFCHQHSRRSWAGRTSYRVASVSAGVISPLRAVGRGTPSPGWLGHYRPQAGNGKLPSAPRPGLATTHAAVGRGGRACADDRQGSTRAVSAAPRAGRPRCASRQRSHILRAASRHSLVGDNA